MIEGVGGQALAVRCDVTRSEDVQAALAKGVEKFGRLDTDRDVVDSPRCAHQIVASARAPETALGSA